MATFGTDTRLGLPTAFQFSYDGVVKDWGTTRLLSVSDVSNQADPVDNKLRISDLTAKFYDSDATIWTALGNGTEAFNKAFSGTIFVGGSMGYQSDDLGVRYSKLSEVGAWVSPFHTGKITDVSKSNDIVTIRSQNLMNLLKMVKWRFPVNSFDNFQQGSFYNKYSFCVENSGLDITWGSLSTHAGYNKKNNNTEMDFYAYPTEAGISGYITGVEGIYDTSQGTGIEDTLISPDVFHTNQFYNDFKALKFHGTFLGVFRGTINDANNAKELGWNGLAESEAHVNVDGDGTFYVVNKMRFEWPSGTSDSSLSEVYYRALWRMEGDPTGVLRHLLFGKMVTPYYTESTHMGTNTFYEAARVTAFKVYKQTINPEDEFVLPYIQDLLNTESALFYVSTDNKFNFEPYGPKNVLAVLEEIGTVDIIESSYTNDINDTYNRVILNYGWSFETEEYTKKKEGTLSSWSITDDRPLDLSSKWIINDNQANASVQRQLARYKQTSPKAQFTTSLKYSGMEIGSLIKLTDPQSGLSDKIIQILDYTKGFGNSNTISFSGYDGESLFLKRGYAKWEGDDDLTALVSGTSTSGWGTTISGVGTCFNINETYYGTVFNYW